MHSRKPQMKGILESKPGSDGRRQPTNVRMIAAASMALGLFIMFIAVVVNVGAIVQVYPFLRPVQPFLLPFLAVVTLLGIVPLVFFVSFQEEFSNLNPLIPSHYAFLLKRSMTAIKMNDFKVSAKDI